MTKPIIHPIFKEIDQLQNLIRELDRYDPLTAIIKEQFELEVARHLTSLSAEFEETAQAGHSDSPLDTDRDRYQLIGQQHAITRLFFDLTQKGPDPLKVILLYEMLFQVSYLPDNQEGFEHTVQMVGKMLSAYAEEKKIKTAHPLMLASVFHHQFISARIFEDGNGRVGRLLLNVMLMRSDYLPILILPEERKEYYKALNAADSGNFSPLLLFLAQKEGDALYQFTQSAGFLSVQGKFELERQLKEPTGSEKCLVLTEDSNTGSLLSLILESSGFTMEETSIISYEGCSKLASANLFSVFVKEKMPHVKIVVHRDRDYLTDAEIEEIALQFQRIDVYFYVTRGTDVESHFLNARHINACHPTISVEEAKRMLAEVMETTKVKSIDLLRKKEFGGMRDFKYSHLNKAIERLVSENLFRFTYGKGALQKLHKVIQKRTGKSSRVQSPSVFLSEPALADIAHRIWGNRQSGSRS